MLLKLSVREPDSFTLLNDNSINPTAVLLLNYHEWQYTGLTTPQAFEQIVDYVNDKEITLYIVNGSTADSPPLHDTSNTRYRNIKIIPFPTIYSGSWIQSFRNKHQSIDTDIESSNFNQSFEHLFISLNNKPHPFRCLQMDMLAKYDLIKQGAVSWNSWNGYEGRDINLSLNYDWKYWKPEILVLDNLDEGSLGWTTQLPNQYAQSFIQLVPETTVHAVMLTEKVMPALMFCKLFLVSSSVGYYNMLSSYGIEPYDELFDYRFDSVKDNTERFDLIAQNIDRIRHLSIKERSNIYKNLLPKIVNNKRKFLKIATNINLWPEFILTLCKQEDPSIKNDSIFHLYNLYKDGPLII